MDYLLKKKSILTSSVYKSSTLVICNLIKIRLSFFAYKALMSLEDKNKNNAFEWTKTLTKS